MSDPFNGFQQPGYTAIPNELLDTFLPILGEAELRVALFIARKTFGWHKRDDDLSLSQIAKGTGLSNPAIITATASLVERGLLVKRVRGKNIAHNYRLNVITSKDSLQDTTSKDALQPSSSNPTLQEVVNEVNSTSKATLQQLVKPVNTQKKVKKLIKENERKEEIAANAAPPSKPVTFEDIQAVPTEARKPTQQQAEVAAWGEVMELDIHIPANANRVGNMLKGLRKSKDCPPVVEVARFRFGRTPPPDASWNFYTHTWQGERGQPPTEREINQYWGAWLKPALKVMSNTNGNARAAPMSRSDRNRQILDEAMAEALGQSPPTGGAIVEGRVIRGHAS